jgi:hypothetical protein
MTNDKRSMTNKNRLIRLEKVKSAGQRKRFVLAFLMNTAALHAQGLEGSRFVTWQFYNMAAGGSRELPRATFLPTASR